MGAAIALAAPVAAGAQTGDLSAKRAATATQAADSDPDIVVTARKRDESAQDVGAALSVFGEDRLELLGAANASSLAYSVPNMIIGNEKADLKVMIRGVGSDNIQAFSDPGVAFHIDGVYQARPSGGNALFYDLQRVEVLRGPQGTLYGRNATGGVVNLISKAPSDRFEGSADFGFGNYNAFQQRAMVNVPIVAGVLAFRAAGTHETRDGYERNLHPGGGTRGNDADDSFGRAQLLFTPGERFDLTLRASLFEKTGVGPSRKRVNPPPGNCPDCNFVQRPDDLRTAYKDARESFDTRTRAFSATANYAFDFATLTMIGAYQKSRTALVQDPDQSFLPFGQPGGTSVLATVAQRSTQESYEARLGSNGDGRLQWLVGGFYMKEHPRQSTLLDRRPSFAAYVNIDVAQDIRTTSLAGFGQLSYDLTDTLKATGGVRYSHDKKDGTGGTVISVDPPGPAPLTRSGSHDFHVVDSWSEVTWKGSLEWKVLPETLLYANASTGYKAGGFNFGSTVPDTYDPEHITAFEVGANATISPAFRINAATFYYKYTNLQVYQVLNQTVFTSNAKGADIFGVEIDAVWKPAPGLRIDLTGGYLDTRYSNFRLTSSLFLDTAPGTPLPPAFSTFNLPPFTRPGAAGQPLSFDLEGRQLINAPRWSGRIGAQYSFDVAGGELTARVQTYLQSKLYLRALNLDPYDRQNGYSKTDARLSYSRKNFTIEAFVDNIENKDVIANMEVTDTGTYLANLKSPRTYGLRVGMNF